MAHERPDELVGLIYDTVSAPQRWRAVLDQIAGRLGAQAAALISLDSRDSRADIAVSTGVLDGAALDSYARDFGRLDPAPAAFARLPVGIAGATDRLFSPEMRARDPFLNEFLRPRGIEECLGAPVLRDEARSAQIGIQRGRDRDPFGNGDAGALERLLPHIQRALQLHRQFAALSNVATTLAALVDDLPSGLLVLNADGIVVHANRTAQAVTARNDGIAIDGAGRVVLASADDATRLAGLVANVLHRDAPGAGGMLRVRRKHGRVAYTVLVTPQPRQLGIDASAADEALHGAMVMIHDPDRLLQVPLAMMRTVFDLTGREAELTAALCGGISPAQFAAQAGVSLNTVRFHLKSVYAKTGTRGQTDLVRTILATLASLGFERHAPLWSTSRAGRRGPEK